MILLFLHLSTQNMSKFTSVSNQLGNSSSMFFPGNKLKNIHDINDKLRKKKVTKLKDVYLLNWSRYVSISGLL
jgi:hypothetical protein